MKSRNVAFITSALVCILFAPTTGEAAELAKSGSYDITNCYAGTSNAIVHSKAHIALGYTITGTTLAKEPGGPFDKSSWQCVGVVRILQGTATGDGMCEWVDADGDKALGRYTRTGNPGGDWTFINGTGKYAGITGGGTSKLLAQFPTVRKGHFQSCERATGTYELK